MRSAEPDQRVILGTGIGRISFRLGHVLHLNHIVESRFEVGQTCGSHLSIRDPMLGSDLVHRLTGINRGLEFGGRHPEFLSLFGRTFGVAHTSPESRGRGSRWRGCHGGIDGISRLGSGDTEAGEADRSSQNRGQDDLIAMFHVVVVNNELSVYLPVFDSELRLEEQAGSHQVVRPSRFFVSKTPPVEWRGLGDELTGHPSLAGDHHGKF